jgi:hypothetical protein
MRYKTLPYFVIFIFLIIVTNSSFAQRGFGRGLPFGRGPKTIGIEYDYFDPSVVHQILGTFSQTMNLGLRPNNCLRGQISFLNLAAGARWGLGTDSTEFRWRAGLIDGDVIIRKILAVGVTILDFNHAGILDEDVRWFNLRFGLGPAIGNGKILIIPKFTGSFGAGRWTLGQTNYSNFGHGADTTLSGSEAGYQGSLSFLLFWRITITGKYSERIFLNSPEPHFKTLEAGTQIRLGKPPGILTSLIINYSHEETHFYNTNASQKNDQLKAEIQFTFLPHFPRPDDWESEE